MVFAISKRPSSTIPYPKARNFHFFEGYCDIEDELLIKGQSGQDCLPGELLWHSAQCIFVICSIAERVKTKPKKLRNNKLFDCKWRYRFRLRKPASGTIGRAT